MKRIVIVSLIFAGVWLFEQSPWSPGSSTTMPAIGEPATPSASQWRSGEQVQGSGTVTRILSDDNDGSRHQRFILQLSSGRTLLVTHNIDLAPRVGSLRTGDTVSFYGQYEWNDQGGVIHWTHQDPQGQHVAGWLEHKGQRYW